MRKRKRRNLFEHTNQPRFGERSSCVEGVEEGSMGTGRTHTHKSSLAACQIPDSNRDRQGRRRNCITNCYDYQNSRYATVDHRCCWCSNYILIVKMDINPNPKRKRGGASQHREAKNFLAQHKHYGLLLGVPHRYAYMSSAATTPAAARVSYYLFCNTYR